MSRHPVKRAMCNGANMCPLLAENASPLIEQTLPRPSSIGVLHPLTCHHNQRAARSTGAFETGEAASIVGCCCHVCRSPRGAWRRHGLEDEVECILAALRSSVDGNQSSVAPPQSPVRSKSQALSMQASMSEGKLLGTATFAPGLAVPASPIALRSPSARLFPKQGSRAAPAVQYGRRRRESLQYGELQECLALLASGQVRPASAPAAGRQGPRTPGELQAHADRVRNRRLANDRDFVERCRNEWDAKIAKIEQRCVARAGHRSASLEKQKNSLRLQAEAKLRWQQWLPILRLIVALQSFHELAVSGRVLGLLSKCGQPMMQMLEQTMQSKRAEHLLHAREPPPRGRWSSVQRLLLSRCMSMRPPLAALTVAAPELAPSDARLSTLRSLRGGCSCLAHGAGLHESLRRAAMASQLLPRLRLMATAGAKGIGDSQWSSCLEEAQLAVRRWQHVNRQWGVLTRCISAALKFSRRWQRLRSGRIVASFLLHIVIHQHLGACFKSRFVGIRKAQRAIRAWVLREATKREVMQRLLEQCEIELLKQHWAAEDMTLLLHEKQMLRQIRGVRERKVHERLITITQENRRRYKRPRSAADFDYIRERLRQHRLPPVLIFLGAQHADAARRLIWRRQLQERRRQELAHARELQMWHDVEQAVRLIDPSGRNPAPRPPAPKLQRLPFFVEVAAVRQIVRGIREWYSGDRMSLQEQIREMTETYSMQGRGDKWRDTPHKFSAVDDAIMGIVRAVLLQEQPCM